jgi:cytochrome oxidase assembly protein ShyY1
MDIAITPVLFSVTFILAIAFGIWQYRRAKIARKEHHRSAAAKAHHEPLAVDDPRDPRA